MKIVWLIKRSIFVVAEVRLTDNILCDYVLNNVEN